MNHRLLYVSPVGCLGGGEQVLHTVARAARDAGYRPSFLCLQPGDFVSQLRDDGFPVTAFRDHRYRDLNAVAEGAALAQRLASEASLVHTNHSGWLYCRHLSQPVIAHYHDYPHSFNLMDLAHRIWKPKNVIFTSEYVRAGFPHLRKSHHAVILPVTRVSPNAQASNEAGASSILKREGLIEGLYFLTVARMQPHKGLQDLLKAIQRLGRSVGDFKFVITGKGGDPTQRKFEERLHAYASHHDLSRTIRFVGFLPDRELQELRMGAYALIHPARTEGFGLVLLDAMRNGLPVVAAAATGPAMIVEHGRSGLLTPVRNPAMLAATIGDLIHSRALRDRLSAGALTRSSCFSAARMTQETLAFYTSVLSRS
ncbi:MAG TPA: glycosyltransferase family 4 protein [Terrimicrobiaceae bacterium]